MKKMFAIAVLVSSTVTSSSALAQHDEDSGIAFLTFNSPKATLLYGDGIDEIKLSLMQKALRQKGCLVNVEKDPELGRQVGIKTQEGRKSLAFDVGDAGNMALQECAKPLN